MPRVIESAEDEDRGWGVRKSPFTYDGAIRDTGSPSTEGDIPAGRTGESLERETRPTEARGLSSRDIEGIRDNPRATTRKIKRPREFPEVPEIPEVSEAMDGLVPVGDSGLYSVPDDAAAPNDCERWPDSPACSNQPLSAIPIGFEDQEVVADDCNLGFSITPVAGFIKLPKYQLVYRKPECRATPPDTSVNREWDIYELPPEFSGLPAPPRPRSCIPAGEDFYCFVGVQYHQRSLSKSVSINPIYGNEFTQSATKITPKLYPPEPGTAITYSDRNNPEYTYLKIPQFTCKYERSFEVQNYFAEVNKLSLGGTRRSSEKSSKSFGNRSGKLYADLTNDYADFDGEKRLTEGEGKIYMWDYDYEIQIWGYGGDVGNNVSILYGLYSNISKYLENASLPQIITDTFSHGYGDRFDRYTRIDTGAQVVWMNVDGENVPLPPCQKKPPPPKRKKCCMGCCPPGKNDDDKWKLIIQKLNKLQKDVDDVQKNIGEPEHLQYHVEKNTEVLKDYGFHRKSEKPNSLFQTFKFINERVNTIQLWGQRVKEAWHVLQPREFIDAKVPKKLIYPGAKGEEKVRGYADVGQVQIRQSDKSAGGWPIRIKVADANPGKKGNQPVVMEVNSVADALRLLLESVIETGGDVDTHTNMLVRGLYMQAQTLQVTSVCEQYLENIEEWLDYPVEQFKLPVPMTISPLAQPAKGFEQPVGKGLDNNTEAETEKLLPHLLQETHQNIRATRFKGGRTLNERLLELFHHVSVVSGTNSTRYQGIPALKTLIEAAVAARKMHGFLDRENLRDALSSGDTDVILKEIEQGYETSAPERKETKSPYNKPQSERPRVKRVSKKRNNPSK